MTARTRAPRLSQRLLVLAGLLCLLSGALLVAARPAHADQGGTIEYNTSTPVKVDEQTAVSPDPGYHQALRTTPSLCSLQPECRFFLLELHYPADANPDTTYFTTVTATLHGTATYQLELFSDPEGNASEVSEDTSTGRTLVAKLATTPDDPDQEYGITMFMTGGAATPFTLTLQSSTVAFPNPFESLNPLPPAVTEPPPTTSPPPIVTSAPTTLPPVTAAPQAAPVLPPAVATPDQSVDFSLGGSSGFQSSLAAPKVNLFKAAVVKPAGKPDPVELWLALLAFPLGLLLLLLALVRRRREEARAF